MNKGYNAADTFLHPVKLFVFVLFLFISPLWAPLWGQSNRPAARTSEPLYDRLLAWNGDEYTLRFEVVVEKEERGSYRSMARRSTVEFSLKLSLPQGNYRFRVIPYDLLGKPGKSSEWITFEVHPPIIAELPKEEQIEEIPTNSEVEEITEIDKIEEVTESKKPAIIGFFKTFDGYITLSWMPVVPAHSSSENPFFDQNLSLAGAGARFGVVYDKPAFINPGMEFSLSWYAFDSTFAFYDRALQHVVSAELDFLAQKWLPNRTIALTFRCGVGITLLQNTMETSLEKRDNFSSNIGLSLLFLPKENIFLETGIDYIYLFSKTYSGYFRPWLGIGWRS